MLGDSDRDLIGDRDTGHGGPEPHRLEALALGLN